METLEILRETSNLRTHVFDVQVRRVDLDANGHVNNGTYQSYFEEARIAAISESDEDWFSGNNSEKLPSPFGSVSLEYKAELRHPNSARIVTFLPQSKTAKFEIVQEMYRQSDNVLVAVARFRSVDPEKKSRSPGYEAIKYFDHSIDIRWTDMSPENHPFLSALQYYFDDARIKSFWKVGIDLNKMNKDGIGPVIYKATIEYFDSLHFPETISVRTRFERGEKNRLVIVQDIFRENGNVHVCRGNFYGLFMNLHSKRPYRFSEEEFNKFLLNE
ncbi:acyl-CoA thioester hydrolase, YbgC/YbaW family [Leptospira fainei serovar Hurstbridge str. BUT 6]|uniref:Acyl-CoA thioester hydrolase, YbgC/YbaW family n=1 Tax=Leptospira fainei serovar Hurstbridge str. BUT 6 TaxID=1193011 RepID=S3UUU6_9LEPT|nr:acyl-CoA thioesterase [Leptospira fainei]EPG74191.1 acyl-CoA thioester hydrolase, YbgC/YbaW family [Leptospira fainei serovar Hurstbridge str. BUT 6]